jgi:hypothetical protein
MKDGKCSHCGSSEVYVSDTPFSDTFAVKTLAGNDIFQVICYLCLNCRAMEFQADDRSVALFGKPKLLGNEVPKSSNWKKVSG